MVKDSPDYRTLVLMLNSLADEDSLKIFNQAAKGFISGKKTIKDLAISSRKYYRALNNLTAANLVKDYKNTYSLTPLGRVIHQLLFCNLTGFLSINQESMRYLDEVSKTREINFIDNYNDSVKFVVNAVDNAKKELLLATDFIDLSIIQSVSNAVERKIKVTTLSDPKLDYPNFFKLIEGLRRDSRPDLTELFFNAEKLHRQVNIPIAFMVIDEEMTIFEVPSKQFKIAFVSADKHIVQVLTEYFWELWHQSVSLKIAK